MNQILASKAWLVSAWLVTRLVTRLETYLLTTG